MKTQMFLDITDRAGIADMLRNIADEVITEGYQRDLEPEEIQQAKDSYAEESLEYFKLKNELIGIAAEYKNRMKPHEDEMYKQLDLIRNRAVADEGELFKIIEHSEQMVGFYDSRGFLVNSRRIRPEERQTTLNSNIREIKQRDGTND